MLIFCIRFLQINSFENEEMKRFWGFVRKEFYHIIRDSKTILVLFGMPVAQMFIFGFALSNEIKDVKIAILDQSKDVVTRQIQSHLFSSGFFIKERRVISCFLHKCFKRF